MLTLKQFIQEKKMSKHEIAVKAHKGENVGHGGFDKVANKAAKEYGSKEAGERVAAAVMRKIYQKNYAKESEELDEKAPPGFEGTVRAMKKHKDIDNPYALSWYLKNHGAKSHYKKNGTKKS